MNQSRWNIFSVMRSGIAIVAVFLLLLYMWLPPEGVPVTEIEIPRGAGARSVADRFREKNIIKSRMLFLAYGWLKGDLVNIHSGSYKFEGSYSIPELYEVLTGGITEETVTIAIPEGSTLRTIADTFDKAGMFNSEALWMLTGVPGSSRLSAANASDAFSAKYAEKFPFLAEKPRHATLEGYLFPDTYNFYKDATSEDALLRMIENFDRRLREAGVFEAVEKQEMSLYEVLILASILEEEAVRMEDKQTIAGVIANRMQNGMPLQIDATLMYVTGKGSFLLTADDLNLDSPYNTYRYKGLPIGPITNPGIESIKAALSPVKTPYVYYLSGVDGMMHYARTFEEHKVNRQKYLQ